MLLPLSPEIRSYEMIKSFRIPKKRYNGTINPYDNVEEFEACLYALNATNRVKCKTFPITLEGSAGNWFRSLPTWSLTSFENLWQVFITKFLSSQKQPLTDVAFLLVKQRPDKSMRSYAKRFSNIHS